MPGALLKHILQVLSFGPHTNPILKPHETTEARESKDEMQARDLGFKSEIF